MKESSRFLRLRPKDIMALFKLLCLGGQLGIFICAWGHMQQLIAPSAQTSLLLFFIYALILFMLHRTYGSMKVGTHKLVNLCTGHLLSLFFGDTLLLLISVLSIRQLPNLWIFLFMFFLQLVFSLLWCLAGHQLYYKVTPAKKTGIIVGSNEALKALESICHIPERYRVEKILDSRDYAADPEALIRQLGGMERIFLGALHHELQDEIIRYCIRKNIPVNILPGYSDVMVSTARQRFIGHTPLLTMNLDHVSLPYRLLKRTMDIAVSALMLLLGSPVLGLVALAIHKEDGGPVFYRQKRLTRHGKEFEILKFRSMRVDAEKDGVARLASQNDDRITKVGRLIRATRLDELPQLINILKGDMALVGPRPERPEIAAQYEKQLPEFSARLHVKAGLTGFAQVHGKYNTTPQEKLKMDLMYITHRSTALDVKLILQTVQILLKKESTEGVSEGQHTALKQDPPA